MYISALKMWQDDVKMQRWCGSTRSHEYLDVYCIVCVWQCLTQKARWPKIFS